MGTLANPSIYILIYNPFQNFSRVHCTQVSDSGPLGLLFIIFLMFSIKKINAGKLKKISVPKSPHISFSALKVGKKALVFFFQLKTWKIFVPKNPRLFCLFVFVLFFYESREKRSGLNMETKTTIPS